MCIKTNGHLKARLLWSYKKENIKRLVALLAVEANFGLDPKEIGAFHGDFGHIGSILIKFN